MIPIMDLDTDNSFVDKLKRLFGIGRNNKFVRERACLISLEKKSSSKTLLKTVEIGLIHDRLMFLPSFRYDKGRYHEDNF